MPADDRLLANDKLGLLALNRFGLGGRADGDLAAAAADPRGFLLAELKEPGLSRLEGPGLPSSTAALQTFFADQEARRLARLQAASAPAQSPPPQPAPVTPNRSLSVTTNVMTGTASTGPMAGEGALAAPAMAQPAAPPAATPPPQPQPPSPEAQIFRAEALARLGRAESARAGFVERLVAFWSNHFCVSIAKGGLIRSVAGAFEREAIRPYVLGRFADMLAAVERHPAMIFYLDNQQSAGPGSLAAQRNGRGLNENLAREILELHTLGVDGGYTQADVVSLANIISGWSFSGRQGQLGEPGSAIFVANFHQPGAQTFLGADYAQDGRAQGEAALATLARHPATARHIAAKFARHFVADDPPSALVARLADTFVRTEGDLAALATALVTSPESWDTSRTKMRDPWQFLMAAIRLTGRKPVDPNPTLGGLSLLGQPLWGPPGPNGFSDAASAWATPEGLKTRLDIADRIASRIPDGPNPIDVLDALAGRAATPDTRDALSRAASKQQALALLLMSPEVQRR